MLFIFKSFLQDTGPTRKGHHTFNQPQDRFNKIIVGIDYYPLNAQNHIVERFWVEINSRVNYPVKRCLVNMEEEGEIDMDSVIQSTGVLCI